VNPKYKKEVHPAFAWVEVLTTSGSEMTSGLSEGVQKKLTTKDAEDTEEKLE
jgi:hypothetical protein